MVTDTMGKRDLAKHTCYPQANSWGKAKLRMEISMHTLMPAIKAIQRDIEQREALLDDGQISDDDADYQGQYVLDLTQALSEIGEVYERSRGGVPEAPSLEKLLGG